MNSIIQKIRGNKTPDNESLDILIKLIEQIYPSEDLDDIKILCELLNKEFGKSFSESDIVNHYIISLEEEDRKLIYEHYVN